MAKMVQDFGLTVWANAFEALIGRQIITMDYQEQDFPLCTQGVPRGAQGGNRTHDLRLTKALLYL
jgi:hypothetical protein